MHARRTAVSGVVAAALVAAGAFGGSLLHSPDERVTTVAPPTVITADVRSAALTTRYDGDGTFSAGGAVPVSAVPPDGMTAIVTATPQAPGSHVDWCTAVVELAGRPVLVLHGSIPLHRDLTVGDEGADVRRLQEALRECGQHVAVDGTFGARTAAALTAVYRRAGYSAVTSPAAALRPAAPDATGDAATTQVAHELVLMSAEVAPPADTAAPAEPAPPADAGPAATATASLATDGPAPTPAPSPTPSAPPAVVAPRGELLFVPSAPRLGSLAGTGAAPTDAPLATLTLDGDRFAFALSAAQRAAVTEGAVLTLTRDDWSETTSMPALPDVPTVDATGTPTYPVVVPLTSEVPSAFYGQGGHFSVVVGSTTPYDLVVPVSALYEDSAGTTYLLRVTRSDDAATPAPPQEVQVRVVASAEGYTAVEVLAGSLRAGDQVVVGEH